MFFIIYGTCETNGQKQFCSIGEVGDVQRSSTVKTYPIKSISSGDATYIWNIQETWGIVGSEGSLNVVVTNCHLCHTLEEARTYAPLLAGCSY